MKNLILIFLAFFVCNSVIPQNNELTDKEIKEGWHLLFNGENLEGWTSVGKESPPLSGWNVENGILTVKKEGEKRGGDIITRTQYSDFDFKVEFRITEGANSGIKYFFTRYEKGGWLGLEYQILDDNNHPDAKMGRNGNRLQAGLYDMFPPDKSKKDSPIGEWNEARIVAKGSKVTHYLNGKKVLSFDRKSKEYKEAVKQSKYKDCVPMFGDVKQGHILLQDHGNIVSFRNIKIRNL
jgi:hypothetical protein